MQPTVHIFDTPQQLAQGFAQHMARLAAPQETFYLAISGGKTPVYLFDYLVENYSETLAWNKVKLFWVDERCVLPTDQESNYLLAKQHLLDKLNIPEENIYRIHGEADPYNEAIRYEQVIKDTVPLVRQVPQFDLVILGMGADGHTASIFPDRIDSIDTERLCISAQHPQSHQNRVSFSMKLINHARHVAFLVTGADKAGRIEEIFNEKEEADLYPANYVDPQSGNLSWYLDKAAAADWEKRADVIRS
jgi:6-phosphogluconolactonase